MAEEAEGQGDGGIGIVDDATMRTAHNKPVGAKEKCTIPKWNALF